MKKLDIIKALLNDEETKESCDESSGTSIQIVILQRGWVTIGRYSECGNECLLENAQIIRTWGTTKGLGEIAEGGPTSSTKLDETPDIRFHKLTMIARMDVNEKNWNKIIK